MKQKLPTRRMRQHPNLEQLKRQAKELQQAFLAGEAAAIAESARTTAVRTIEVCSARCTACHRSKLRLR